MVRLLRHRQTKGAATARPNLTPPRHIPTLPTTDGRLSLERSFTGICPLRGPPSAAAGQESLRRADLFLSFGGLLLFVVLCYSWMEGGICVGGRDRNAARAALGKGLAVSAFPRDVPV